VVLAIAQAGVDVSELELGARNGFTNSSPKSVINSLVRCLRAAAQPLVLVLDDYHLVENDELNTILKILIGGAPISFTLIINSRSLPDLDASTYLATGEAIKLGPEELRLTREETFDLLGAAFSHEDAQNIYRQTEGWPVAVQLARLRKRSLAPSSSATAVAGGMITSYLTDQVLSEIDHEVRDFLFSISLLDRFNPQLANAIRDRSDSWQFLDRLQPLTALLVPLDPEKNWYRLHHLFAEYLRESLKKQDPERIGRIYRRASRWFAARGGRCRRRAICVAGGGL